MYNMIFVSVKFLVGSPSQHVSQTKKVIWPTALFSDSEHFFVQLLSQPSASQLSDLYSVLLYFMLYQV